MSIPLTLIKFLLRVLSTKSMCCRCRCSAVHSDSIKSKNYIRRVRTLVKMKLLMFIMYDFYLFRYISVVKATLVLQDQDGRVVKALDLRSNGSISAWVRTPLLVFTFSSILCQKFTVLNVIVQFLDSSESRIIK